MKFDKQRDLGIAQKAAAAAPVPAPVRAPDPVQLPPAPVVVSASMDTAGLAKALIDALGPLIAAKGGGASVLSIDTVRDEKGNVTRYVINRGNSPTGRTN